MTDRGTKRDKNLKTIYRGQFDRKQTDHCAFKSDFNNCEIKIQTKDRMDEK